jgi:hypothetical protein
VFAVDNTVVLANELNQATVAPVGGVAINCTAPVPHLAPGVVAGLDGADTIETSTAVLVADTQPLAVVIDST